jgi:hypothetical protein
VEEIYIIAAGSFIGGFTLAFIILMIKISKLKKELKSTSGYLESEKLMKENFRKENKTLQQLRQVNELELIKKLQDAQILNRKMDEDILLLQKSNEETEQQLATSQPELHAIKLKLIEAQNTIARYKAQLEK